MGQNKIVKHETQMSKSKQLTVEIHSGNYHPRIYTIQSLIKTRRQ